MRCGRRVMMGIKYEYPEHIQLYIDTIEGYINDRRNALLTDNTSTRSHEELIRIVLQDPVINEYQRVLANIHNTCSTVKIIIPESDIHALMIDI